MNNEKVGNCPYISVDELIEKIRRYHPDDDMDLVRRAYAFSEEAHREQRRKSGDPYFVHPCAVAVILADLMLDATTIAAGLLHDCVEDVECVTAQTIGERFGQDVELLVDGVTKLSKLDFSSREEQQAESLRKMFLAMAKDIRVVLIKLADRLHNMRTLKYQKPERQVPSPAKRSTSTRRLRTGWACTPSNGNWRTSLCATLDPDGYYDLVAKVGMRREEREKLIASVTQQLQDSLRKTGIKAEIEGRPKHFYSIYKKMKSQNKTFDQINDLIAIRVLVNTSRTAIMCWAWCIRSGRRCRAGSRTTSPCPRPTCISRCTPPWSIRAGPSKCRFAPLKCTAPPNTASPPIGATKRASRSTNWTPN